MKHIFFAALVLAPCIQAQAATPDVAAPSAKVKRFVTDVVYVVEAGDRERITKKWTVTPQLVVNSPDSALKAYVETAFAQLCEAAKLAPAAPQGPAPITDTTGSKSKSKAKSKDAPAAQPLLTVSIGQSRALSKEAYNKNPQISMRSGQTYWTWWNDDGSLREAVVYLATDNYQGAEAEFALLTNLVSTFGFPARSKEFDETILAARRSQTKLTDLDRMLFAFYYTHVPPGTKKTELGKLVDEKWGK